MHTWYNSIYSTWFIDIAISTCLSSKASIFMIIFTYSHTLYIRNIIVYIHNLYVCNNIDPVSLRAYY